MAKNEAPTIDVKLFVDKEKKKVLFAESDKEFVDVLFAFLTMPLGTIVRLLGKQSQMGCLDELYKSVEDLSTGYFQTKACKVMLLKPLNASSSHCCRLKINIDDTNPRAVYVCRDTNCCAYGDCAFSSVPDTICKCGKVMGYVGDRPENDAKIAATGSENGVFVKGPQKFITTDDLQVAPASTSLMLSLCQKFGVQDPADLEQSILQLTSEKITSLLKRSLTSNQPLTGLHFDVPISPDDATLSMIPGNLSPEQLNETEGKMGNVKIKILQTKINSAVLYAEVGHDFVELVFGLLGVPLGSITKIFGQSLSKGCIDNLYRSIDGTTEGHMRADCQILLLAPELAAYFGSGASQILQVNESAPRKLKINSCFRCFKIGAFSNLSPCHETYRSSYSNCFNLPKTADLCELDPKSPGGKSSNSDAYVKQASQSFMVTDDLRVRPLSLDSSLRVVSEAKMQMKDLVEKEVTLTKLQIMELQRAAVMSRDALSSVLLPPKKKKKNLKHLRY